MNGHRYFVIFIDDATKCTWVYPNKSKDDEVMHAFITYHKMVKTKFDRKIKAFWLHQKISKIIYPIMELSH